MKVIVTASDSAIGKYFVGKYASQHEIIPVEKFDLDFTDMKRVAELFKSVKPEAVVHLDELRDDPSGDVNDKTVANYNSVCFKNLQTACRVYRAKKLIILGTGKEYETTEGELKGITEDAPAGFEFASSYIESKRSISKHAKNDGITTILRIFDIFGAGCYGDGTMMDILNRIVGNHPLEFDKDMRFSTVFSEDVASIINRILSNKDFPAGDYNCAYPEPLLLSEAVRLAKKACYKLLPVRFKSQEIGLEYTCSTDKLTNLLDDFQFTPPLLAVGRTYKQLNTKQN